MYNKDISNCKVWSYRFLKDFFSKLRQITMQYVVMWGYGNIIPTHLTKIL